MSKLADVDRGQVGEMRRAWAQVLPGVDLTGLLVTLQSARINVLATRLMSRIGKGFGGLGCPDISVLMALRLEPGQTARPSDLGREFNVTPAAITYRVNRLSQMGLVERLTHPGDKRVVSARLTKTGELTIDAIMKLISEATLEQTRGLDAFPQGASALVTLIGALVEHWESADQPEEPALDAAARPRIAAQK